MFPPRTEAELRILSPGLENAYTCLFLGIDNYVTIDDSGDRDPDYALQDFHDSRFEDFVHYDHITKELTFTPNFIPTWPGGETTPPKGEPDCGWDEEHCQSNTGRRLISVNAFPIE